MSLVREESVRCTACLRSYVVEYAVDNDHAVQPVALECPHCGAKAKTALAAAAYAFQTRKPSVQPQ